MVSDNCWGSFKIFPVGPKRSLETSISKKKLSPLPVTKDFDLLLVLSNVLRGTSCTGPKGTLAITVEVIRSIL